MRGIDRTVTLFPEEGFNVVADVIFLRTRNVKDSGRPLYVDIEEQRLHTYTLLILRQNG